MLRAGSSSWLAASRVAGPLVRRTTSTRRTASTIGRFEATPGRSRPTGAGGRSSCDTLGSGIVPASRGSRRSHRVRKTGQPGAANSSSEENPPPAIRDVTDKPLVPAQDEDARTTCRITSVHPIESAIVDWQVDGTSGDGLIGGRVGLEDLGTDGDAVAGDGVFTAVIPGQRSSRIVRYRVTATDSQGSSERLPLDPAVLPFEAFEGNFFLYGVDSTLKELRSPFVRIVMKASSPAESRSQRPIPKPGPILLPSTCPASETCPARETSRPSPAREDLVACS